MKKLSIITTGLILFLATTGYAWGGGGNKTAKIENASGATYFGGSDVKVIKDITNSFATKFSGAQGVNWKQQDEFYFADFKFYTKDMHAAYSNAGELLGFSRDIEFSEMPLNVQMAFRERYADYKLDNNVTELVFDSETTYYLNAENKARYLKLKSDSQGQISVEKRTKKRLIGTVY